MNADGQWFTNDMYKINAVNKAMCNAKKLEKLNKKFTYQNVFLYYM